MAGWAEKYRAKLLDDVGGNPTAVAELRKWAAAWDKGRPDKRAVILQGDPGIGKTSAALALANETGWSAIEMNASESRNAEAIRRIATRGAVLQPFRETGEFVRSKEGGRKLIILDEADNVFGREDKGGIGAIVEMIQETRQPVVLIANDYYALTRRSSSLKRLCKTIKFQGVHEDAMKNILRTIASKESVDVTDDVFDVIVERAGGHLPRAHATEATIWPLVVRERDDVKRRRRRPQGACPGKPARVPVLSDPNVAVPRPARRPQLRREEAGEDVACFPVDRPHRSLVDDPNTVLRGRGAADPPHRRTRPPRTGGGRPPRRAADEPCRESSFGESRQDQGSSNRRTRTRSAFLFRHGGRCGLSAESDSGGSSTRASSARSRSWPFATCSRSSIDGGACRSWSWLCPRERRWSSTSPFEWINSDSGRRCARTTFDGSSQSRWRISSSSSITIPGGCSVASPASAALRSKLCSPRTSPLRSAMEAERTKSGTSFSPPNLIASRKSKQGSDSFDP